MLAFTENADESSFCNSKSGYCNGKFPLLLLKVGGIAAESRIDQQDRYPSTRRAAKLLSTPQDIRSHEARETWRIMVAALGYKGRGSLDKGGKGIASSGQV